jgi:hypothetical protein
MLGPMRQQVTVTRRKLHNGELHSVTLQCDDLVKDAEMGGACGR